MAEVSVYLVIGLGILLGNVVKGITGFGGAIIHLCVWVVFHAVGVNTGTLQQAVLAECISGEVLALPLLVAVKAYKTCDWKLFTSLIIFTAAGSPVGAAFLIGLNERLLQLVMACILLVVIIVHCKVHHLLLDFLCCRKKIGAQHGSKSNGYTAVAADEMEIVPVVSKEPRDPLLLANGDSSNLQHDADSSVTAERSSTFTSHEPQRQDLEMPDVSHASHHKAAPPVKIDIEPPAYGTIQSHDSVEKESPAMDSIARVSGSSHGSSKPPPARHIDIGRMWLDVRQHFTLSSMKQWGPIFLLGCLAGLVSGVMLGMTGMGGPPLMLLYEKLQTPKDVVRGTNSVLNLLQVRIISYIMMGAIHKSDLALYAMSIVAAAVGLLLGLGASSRINQKLFSHILVALMLLCCAMLFASAAGLKQ